MNTTSLLFPFAWILNGLLVFFFTLLGQWQAVLLLPVLVWLVSKGPAEHRPWSLGISGGALLAALISPQPVPILLLAMGLSGCAALSLERFNPASLHWRLVSGIGLYALAGIGLSAFQGYINRLAPDSALIAQGQTYIGILSAVAIYGLPLGFLAMLAQGLLVHPPIPGGGSPEELIQTLRARGEE